MADVLRSCSKTACRWPAAASLSYRYATRQVWLLDLAPTNDPSLYDLCPHHADALTVPNGWERVDDRTVQEVMVEPSANDRAEEAARRRISAADPSIHNVRSLVSAMAGPAGPAGPADQPPRNRYADLVDQLPRLAAEAGVPGASPAPGAAEAVTITAGPVAEHPSASAPSELRAPTVIGPRTAPEQPAVPTSPAVPTAAEPPLPPESAPSARPVMQHARSGAPIPSRDLAPLPPADSPLTRSEAPDVPMPGQLSIPVDVDDDDRGVVVPFDLAGGRRRNPRT